MSTTNTTVKQEMDKVWDELGTKSTNGHLTPDNVYEFAVVFLLSLGIINVMDMARRLILYSISQRAPDNYGNE